jgi:hypothetical protein
MKKRLAGRAWAIGILISIVGTLPGNTRPAVAQTAAAAPLTALDRIDIQQLVARYSYALDAAGGDDRVFAELFLPDGVLVTPDATAVGHDRLSLVRRTRRSRGPRATLATNILLEGSGNRATGRVYVIELHGNGASAPGSLSIGGQFRDEYVRTSGGWRFARREFIPSRLEDAQ